MLDAISTMIPQERIRDILPDALPWLEKTVAQQPWLRWGLDAIVQELLRGNLQLWGLHHSKNKCLFVVTEVVMEPAGKSVHVILGGGTLDEEREACSHLALIEQWALAIGATSVAVWGRLGWKKVLSPHGYEFEAAVYRNRLNQRMH